MLTKRELQKKRLRKIIREACGEQRAHEMPCPISAANKLKASGASPDEVMGWISQLIEEYYETPESELAIHNPLAQVAVERYQQQGNIVSKNKPHNRKQLRLGSTLTGYGFEK